MGLPIHGSQNMNHIRLINKLNYVKARYDYLLNLSHNPKRTHAFNNETRLNMRRYGQSAKNFDTNFLYSSKFNCLKQRAKHNNTHISCRYKQRANTSNANMHKSSLSLPLKSTHHHSHNNHKMHKQKLTNLRKAIPMISNMPFIHLNSSLILINSSPFALTDRRFGILHHHSPSISYY